MSSAAPRDNPETIRNLLAVMDARAAAIPAHRASLRDFLLTYRRTTAAVAEAVSSGLFEDPAWVERWDIAFAAYYLDALDRYLEPGRGPAPRPWRMAFDASRTLPPLLNVLLGVNAHINNDLPRALLAVITDADFEDAGLVALRRRDHRRIDAILAGRVAAEDEEISSRSVRTLLDRALRPVNRWASRRFLAEAREKVWANTTELSQARRRSAEEYRARLGELETLTAAKVSDLLAPGQVLIRLAVSGFGVTLPPPR